jgi:hypothetical protein
VGGGLVPLAASQRARAAPGGRAAPAARRAALRPPTRGRHRARCPPPAAPRPPLPLQAQKRKILHDVIANINMKHGDGALMKLGDKPLAV